GADILRAAGSQRMGSLTWSKPSSDMMRKYSGFQGFPHSVSVGASKVLPMLIPLPSFSFISKAGNRSWAQLTVDRRKRKSNPKALKKHISFIVNILSQNNNKDINVFRYLLFVARLTRQNVSLQLPRSILSSTNS